MTWVYVAVPRDGDRKMKPIDVTSTRHSALEKSLDRMQQRVQRNIASSMDSNTQKLQSSHENETVILKKKVSNLEQKVDMLLELMMSHMAEKQNIRKPKGPCL
jgi:hypothetical protein